MGAAAAAAENQLGMDNLEGIDEQETGIRNTALDRQTKVPDHVDFAPNTEAQASWGDAVNFRYMGDSEEEIAESSDEYDPPPIFNQAGEEPF